MKSSDLKASAPELRATAPADNDVPFPVPLRFTEFWSRQDGPEERRVVRARCYEDGAVVVDHAPKDNWDRSPMPNPDCYPDVATGDRPATAWTRVAYNAG